MEGERILSPGRTIKDGHIELRLSAQQTRTQWKSELSQSDLITLTAEETPLWVEQWIVNPSPVWHVSLSGLSPIYQEGATNLIPTWNPWPGESASLAITQPKAIQGETMTVRDVLQSTTVGDQHRTTTLTLNLETSIGQEFPITLPSTAQVTSLTLNHTDTAVRREGDLVIIALRPGEQRIELVWKNNVGSSFYTESDLVELPIQAANVTTKIHYENRERFPLWFTGPLIGPVIFLWPLVILSIVAAFILARRQALPLKTYEWVILLLGLTQGHIIATGFILIWFFWIACKPHVRIQNLPSLLYNGNQVIIAAGACIVVLIFLYILYSSLQGLPGQHGYDNELKWYQAVGDSSILPSTGFYSIPMWGYRGLMLFWAIWLTFASLRWLKWGWSLLQQGQLLRPLESSEQPTSES